MCIRDRHRLSAERIRAFVDLSSLQTERIEVGASHPYQEDVHVELPSDAGQVEAVPSPERITLLLKNPAD